MIRVRTASISAAACSCRGGTTPVGVEEVGVQPVGAARCVGLVEQLQAASRRANPVERVGELAKTEDLDRLVGPRLRQTDSMGELEGQHELGVDEQLAGG